MVFESRFNCANNGPDHSGSLGFSNVPQQVHRKSVKKGFEFTMMVCGQSGLGKSTFVNALLATDLYSKRTHPRVEDLLHSTVEIVSNTIQIEEKGVKLKITVIDTPGMYFISIIYPSLIFFIYFQDLMMPLT